MSNLEQWVNLEKTTVDDDGIKKPRMGHFIVECEFDKAKLSGFKVTIEDKGGSKKAKYKKKEEKRNKNFRIRKVGASSNGSKKKVKLEKKIFLPAAGGNLFKVSAKCKGTVVESGKTLETRRKLWYQPMPMSTLTHTGYTYSSILDAMEDAYWNVKERFYIKLKRKNQCNIDFKQNLDIGSDRNWIWNTAKAKFSIGQHNPHTFGLTFVGHICRPSTKGWTTPPANLHNVTLPSRIFTWTPADQVIIEVLPFYLWYDLNSVDDAAKSWLVGRPIIEFKPSDGGPAEPLHISRDDCVIDGGPLRAHGGRNRVKITLKGNAIKRNRFTKRSGTITVKLMLRTAEQWTLGYSEPSFAIVVIGTRCFFDDLPSKTVKYVANHEVGHAIGMVSDGKGLKPNKPASLYGEKRGVNDRGHQGPHCGKGAVWTAATKTWSGTPGCVMFGANGIGGNHAPPTYCSDCAPIVRKLDLSDYALKTGSFGTKMS